MTPEQLAEIRARAEAATPGPWVVVPEYEAGYSVVETTADGGFPVCGIDYSREHDQQFIAHARADIPALLDYIEELQAVGERLHRVLLAGEFYEDHDASSALLGELRAALASKEPTNA